jgi:hypothetical protein
VVWPSITVEGELREWVQLTRANPTDQHRCPDRVPAEAAECVALLKKAVASPTLDYSLLAELLAALGAGLKVSTLQAHDAHSRLDS